MQVVRTAHIEEDAEEMEPSTSNLPQTLVERARVALAPMPPPATSVLSQYANMEVLPILLGPGKQVVMLYPLGLSDADIEDFEVVWQIYKKRITRNITPPTIDGSND